MQEEVRVLKEILAALTGIGRISFIADQRHRLSRWAALLRLLHASRATMCATDPAFGFFVGENSVWPSPLIEIDPATLIESDPGLDHVS
jgi:hypothetical protein